DETNAPVDLTGMHPAMWASSGELEIDFPEPTPKTPNVDATEMTFGADPLSLIRQEAITLTNYSPWGGCGMSSADELAALMLAPIPGETGAKGTNAPSPMTLGRSDFLSDPLYSDKNHHESNPDPQA